MIISWILQNIRKPQFSPVTAEAEVEAVDAFDFLSGAEMFLRNSKFGISSDGRNFRMDWAR